MNRARSGTHRQWRKSSRSSDTANCVEVALASAEVGVRDSQDPQGPALAYAAGSWREFIIAVQAGEFDLPGTRS
jgi:Domain of unknown function (DUF397)